MRIWIVNYYAEPPENDTNHRYFEFTKHFKEKGWEVVTFNASFLDNAVSREFKERQIFLHKQYDGHDFVHIKSPRYKGNGLGRMKSIFTFAWRLLRHRNEFERPDVILHNVHAPFDFPIVLAAKKLKSKYISEVWDLWPDNFVNFGLVSRHNPIMPLFYAIEKWIYYHADQLVFTIPGAINYLKDKGWTTTTGGRIIEQDVHYINNGVNLGYFDHNVTLFPRKDADINEEGIYKIIYMGTISFANHVKMLIDTAAILQSNPKYQFYIYGDGAQREELEHYVQDNSICNVHFKEKRIPLYEVAWIVSQSTVNVMTYEKGFGYMGVSSGKMFQYLAAGKPIVCNINIAYDNVIWDNNLGVAKDIDSPAELASIIQSLAELPKDEYDAMCERVRIVAKRFDYSVLAEEEIKVIEAALRR